MSALALELAAALRRLDRARMSMTSSTYNGRCETEEAQREVDRLRLCGNGVHPLALGHAYLALDALLAGDAAAGDAAVTASTPAAHRPGAPCAEGVR